MSTLSLSATKIRAGTWEGVVLQSGSGVPQIEVRHLDQPLEAVELSETDREGQWLLRVPIPTETIADGVQTFVISDQLDGEKLGHFSLIAGEALGDDIRSEVDLLRAELDMLKRAFRRHCVETG